MILHPHNKDEQPSVESVYPREESVDLTRNKLLIPPVKIRGSPPLFLQQSDTVQNYDSKQKTEKQIPLLQGQRVLCCAFLSRFVRTNSLSILHTRVVNRVSSHFCMYITHQSNIYA